DKDAKLAWPSPENLNDPNFGCRKTDELIKKDLSEFLEGFTGIASIMAWDTKYSQGTNHYLDIVEIEGPKDTDSYEVSLVLD
ncbi:hypothetical protein, partial [Mesorhizobium japonicum]|uniref:hypothetical protein n=1 Tax=Mesorhizobium japonicum TaxID=2066070 RepID=UPI003B5BFD8F